MSKKSRTVRKSPSPLKTRLAVRLQPRASRDELVGWNEEGVLRVRVKAPPVGGAANAALVRLLARGLNVAKSDVSLVSGTTARLKIVEITGVTEDMVRKGLTGSQGA